MFCPKCGTKNPEDGKYCRSCGVDLGNVSAALTSTSRAGLHPYGSKHPETDNRRRSDPAELYGDSIKEIISGFGFLSVAMVLLITGVAGGKVWWWAMLFPAFTFFAKGISDLLKSRKMESSLLVQGQPDEIYSERYRRPELSSITEDYITPRVGYQTGDLVPPSVTDNTTRHLELDNDGDTMTLPKH
jgi:hypothetical protein